MSLPKTRTTLLTLASLAAIGLAIPAIGQEAPESLLPPGFGSAPAPAPRAPSPATAPAAVDPAAPAEAGEGPLPDESEVAEELPRAARRAFDRVGPLVPANGGFGEGSWGKGDGRALISLMRRLDAPIASRWGQILLRRALLSRTAAPAGVSPADWVAARAGLLLRLGEADGARMLVEGVDPDNYNAGLLRVAQQTAYATADAAGLCPLTARALRLSKDRSWDYARAICAAFAGDSSLSTMYLDRARGRAQKGFDHLLAEKLIGAAGQTRRAANADWADVGELTPWRFGMASAAAFDVPEALLRASPVQYQAWRARAPMLAPEARIGSARIAATLGVMSSAGLVDLYGQAYDREGDTGRDAPAMLLRTAYRDEDQLARMAALRSLWVEGAKQPGGLYASHLLTARAAARIMPDDSFAADYANLVAAMLSAGLDRQAARWATLVGDASPSIGDEAWALLAVGAPRASVDLSFRRIDGYGARLGPGRALKVQMLVAALGGLGRISADDFKRLAEKHEVVVGPVNAYTRSLAASAARRETSAVALLVATGMQTPDWRYVPPSHLYHIVAALRRTGNEPAARMIAAEALSRL